MHIINDITFLEAIHDLQQNKPDMYNNSHYVSVPSVIDLSLKNNAHNIVEIYSPFGYVSETMSSAFEDVHSTCINETYNRDVDGSSDNIDVWVGNPLDNVDEFDDESIDLLFIFQHTFSSGDYLSNITPWLPKVKSETGIICGHNPGLIALSTPGMTLTESAECVHGFARENLFRVNRHITGDVDEIAFYYMHKLELPEEGPEYIDPELTTQ